MRLAIQVASWTPLRTVKAVVVASPERRERARMKWTRLRNRPRMRTRLCVRRSLLFITKVRNVLRSLDVKRFVNII